jgi:coenzyme Q-binding protein COQ10
MPSFKASRRVAVPAHVAYTVACDVGSYKDFLPLVERSLVRGSVTEVDGVQSFSAEVAVGYARLNLQETFYSRVSCDPQGMTVTATSQDAPFRQMQTIWTIRDLQGQSDVSVAIDYSMRSALLQFAVAGAMDVAVNRIMSAFEARAKVVQMASKTN